jgi:hypothetical protein
MARPLDPLDDVNRVADLIDQTVTLLQSGCPLNDVLDIQQGLAARLRENVDLIRSGQQTDGMEVPLDVMPTCECCGQERKRLPFHSERFGVTYCQECYDTGCSIGAEGGGCDLR